MSIIRKERSFKTKKYTFLRYRFPFMFGGQRQTTLSQKTIKTLCGIYVKDVFSFNFQEHIPIRFQEKKSF